MDHIYNINADIDIPIYQQLVDSIRVAIKKEILLSGQQLPTVAQLTDELGIARGTVKRAYDELEHLGLVEKVQGRGTFVSYHPDNSGSRKERAMAAIGTLFDNLEDMGFTPNEINIFLNLKLRELSEKQANVKVVAVECNPENLSQISNQLRHIGGVDLYSYSLDNIKQYPYKLGENFDLIITTSSHAEYLESVVPAKNHIARIALRPSIHSLSGIIKIASGKKVGIVSYSKRFGQLLQNTCKMYTEGVTLYPPLVCADEADIKAYLNDKDVILVPEAYEKLFSSQMTDAINKFSGEIINCYYKMDEGSVLYLETKIKKILDTKII